MRNAQSDLGRLTDLVGQGALRATVSARDEGYSHASLSISTFILLGARKLADEKQWRQATQAILDVCQYGRDVAESQGDFGMFPLKWGFDEVRINLVTGRYDLESLQTLEEGLRILDGSFPSIDQERLRWARTLAADARSSRNDGLLKSLFHRDTCTTYCELLLRAVGTNKSDWLHERQALRELDLELAKSFNPYARHSVLELEWSGASFRHARAQLRLLLMATHFLAKGEGLDLEDPFGGRLKTSVSGTSFKAWSLGRDGIDDGGVGEWGLQGKDIVLEFNRR